MQETNATTLAKKERDLFVSKNELELKEVGSIESARERAPRLFG
jgi:hypothetical protein